MHLILLQIWCGGFDCDSFCAGDYKMRMIYVLLKSTLSGYAFYIMSFCSVTFFKFDLTYILSAQKLFFCSKSDLSLSVPL